MRSLKLSLTVTPWLKVANRRAAGGVWANEINGKKRRNQNPKNLSVFFISGWPHDNHGLEI
jgi:hypothetical protein